MSEIQKIGFEEQSKEIKNRVTDYWTKRAEGFYELRAMELESNKADRWFSEINAFLPQNRKLKILDIGCGTGFFEVLLGRNGHEVFGIDLTQDMVTKTREMITRYGLSDHQVKAFVMDAEKLSFETNTFDVILARNLTWTLPHPIEAYGEWHRVLKPGGILLNFDAEYAKNAHSHLYHPENLAHQDLDQEMKDECHEIYHMLTISSLERPEWDLEVLKKIGFEDVKADLHFGDRIFQEKDRFYMLDKMFCISGVKESSKI